MPNIDIQHRVKQVLAKILSLPATDIGSDAARDVTGNWDSLKHMYVVLALEEEFSIEFDSREIADMRTLSDLVGTVTTKLASGQDNA
jgi:acyl carrier protein